MKCGKAAQAILVLLSLITVVLTENQSKVKRQIIYPDDDDDDDGSFDTPSREVQRNGSPCTTPSNERGQCVEYFRCPKLAGTRIDLNVLRRYQCGYSGQDPKICCPESTPTRPTPRPVTPTPNPRPSPPTRKPPTRRPPPITNRPVPVTPSTSEPLERTNRPRHLPKECGRGKSSDERILGGQEAEIGAWPWMAAIYQGERGKRTPNCGGAIISPTHILTAAHCIVDDSGNNIPAREFSVHLGDHDLFSADDKTDPVDIDVDKIIPHPRFNLRILHNDIAILVMKRPVQFNEFIQPICLAYDRPMRTNNYVGKTAVVAGWGEIGFDGPKSSKLTEVHIPVWNHTSCREAYRKYIPINNNYMCAGLAEGGKDACRGDSGGPLMLSGGPQSRFHLVGVVSFGKKCGLPNFPGVYTNVRNYLDWISENTA